LLLPSLLITTSRKTSNRIRSFTRDLWSVIPESIRFNRGGMSRTEIVARLINQDANSVIIVTMYKGNPNNLEVVSSEGKTMATIFMESAMLRREVLKSHTPRINSISAVSVKQGSSKQANELAQFIGSLVGIDVIETSDVNQTGAKSSVVFWFRDLSKGKVLWTHYHAFDGAEIGPRIRVSSFSRRLDE
jgi:U3 small nucleolar ribonucleoprotein protein IMP4